MAIYLTRKHSLILGISLIALFFVAGIFMLYKSNTSQAKSITAISHEKKDKSADLTDVKEVVQPVAEKLDPTAPVVLNKFHRNQIRDGKKLWEVLAEKGKYLPGSNNAELDEAELFLFRKDGSKVHLTAQKALLNFSGTDLSQAKVSGKVLMIYNDKVQMRTEDATYDKVASTVIVPGEVSILTDNIEVSGKDLLVDIEKQEMLLRKDVSTIIQPRGN